MEYFRKLYRSCEMSDKQKKMLLTAVKHFLDRRYRSARVSKSEIQRITGIGTHTCTDRRNYKIITLYTLLRAIEQIHRVKFDFLMLLRKIEESIDNGTELIIYEVKPGEKIQEGGKTLMKRQQDKRNDK